MPAVSIQMCCFNGEKYLREAINSIVAQSFQDWELIFWDNCSTDGSASIVQSYNDPRIKYYLAPNHTDLGGGRARSWPLLTGDFIAFLDVDDKWKPNKLALQLPLFADPEVAIVTGDVMWVNAKHQQLVFAGHYPPEGHVTSALLRHYFLSLPGVTIRREAAEKAGGGFDPDFSHNADFDLFLRTSTVGKVAIVKQHIASWRVDMNSQSWASRDKFEREHFKWTEKHKRASWTSTSSTSFVYYQIILIAKKLYFALNNRQYKTTPATGLLRVLDHMGLLGFWLLRWTPVTPLIKSHMRRRIKKWC